MGKNVANLLTESLQCFSVKDFTDYMNMYSVNHYSYVQLNQQTKLKV